MLRSAVVPVFVQETAEKQAESISCCRGAARQANMHQGGAVFCLQQHKNNYKEKADEP